MLIHPTASRRVLRRSVPSITHGPSILDEIWHGLRVAPAGGTAAFVPRVDVSDTQDSLLLVAELPGVEKGDFEVVVDGEVLTIKGEKKVLLPEEALGATRLERSGGEFSRAFRVPFDVEPDSVKATYRHGVLTVTVPKPAVEQARTIPITTD